MVGLGPQFPLVMRRRELSSLLALATLFWICCVQLSLCFQGIWNGNPVNVDSSGRDYSCSCKEDGLCFSRVKGEAASVAPLSEFVNPVLKGLEKEFHIRTSVCNGTIISKRHTPWEALVNEANRRIKSD